MEGHGAGPGTEYVSISREGHAGVCGEETCGRGTGGPAAPADLGEKAEEKTVKNRNGLVLAAALEEKEIPFRVRLSVSRNIHGLKFFDR